MIPDHTEFSSLPQWAQTTLAEHSADERPYVYTLEQFEEAQTHDPLWNAAQQQLRQEGIITITCGCFGARKYWNGPRTLKPPCDG